MKPIKLILLIVLISLVTDIFCRHKTKRMNANTVQAAPATAGADSANIVDPPCQFGKMVYNRAVSKCVKASGRRLRKADDAGKNEDNKREKKRLRRNRYFKNRK